VQFIDFFSGIGGFRLGMEMAGHECVGHCEIDKFANASYKAMHNVKEDEWYANDITRVSPGELPEADCYCGGFPCQAFSIAGKRGGFADTRGTLFFEVMRLARERKPKYLLLENVAGLLSHDNGNTFATIIQSFADSGYDVQWQILNSKDFGVPQNRERVFFIGHLRGQRRPEVFPLRGTSGETLKQIIGGSQGDRVYDPSGVSCTLASQAGGKGAKTGLYLIGASAKSCTKIDVSRCLDANYHKGYGNQERTAVLEVRPVLTPDRPEKRQNGRRMKEDGEPMFTLTAQDRHGVALKQVGTLDREGYNDISNRVYSGEGLSRTLMGGGGGNDERTGLYQVGTRIRRLTPKECFRLQGFPDEYFERARAANSDTQLYKQAGNTVSVPVIYEIARRLK
jgi:DNA (cytosine-5)-methyltransferase 1